MMSSKTQGSSSLPLGGVVTGKPIGGSGLRMPEYVRRAFNFPQMDIDYTFWQMLYLCFSPSRVYRTTKYHRQTKNQWARDDPAFVAVIAYFMAVASVGYAIAFHRKGLAIVAAVAYSVFVDFLLVGACVATLTWWLTNSYLRVDNTGSHTTEQKVEWLYAFDVHCNSFFPTFIILYVVQYFLLPVLMRPGIAPLIIANLLYGAGLSYYFYVTFLGFDILPFLQYTVVLLYPIGPIMVMVVVLPFIRINICHLLMKSYFG